MSYQDSESKAVDALKKAIPDSLKKDMLPLSKGLSAEIYQNDEVFPNHYLACAIDSAGTKVMLAELMDKYDTIGIDCVAMSANDLATFGSMSPFLFMDCLSTQKKIQERSLTAEIMKGIVKGLEECDASSIFRNSISLNLGKGETASVHELLDSPRAAHAFDLVGCMIGFIPKNKLYAELHDGDTIIALPSSGAHCNGFTDLRHHILDDTFESREEFRKLYKGKHTIDDTYNGKKIGNLLLEPTKLYVRDMALISKDHDVVGVNNTGYGLKNLNRLPGEFQMIIDNAPEPLDIFKLMQQESQFSDEQMYSTFNMGMGFFVIAKKQDSENILQKIKGSMKVGTVKKGKKSTIFIKEGKKIVFEGY